MGKSFRLFHLGQYLLILDDVFIGCQQDVELPAAELRHKPPTQRRSSLQGKDRKGTILLSKRASQTNNDLMHALV